MWKWMKKKVAVMNRNSINKASVDGIKKNVCNDKKLCNLWATARR